MADHISTIASCLWAVEPITLAEMRSQFRSADKEPGAPEMEVTNGVAVIQVNGIMQPALKGTPMYGGVNTFALTRLLNSLETDESVDAVVTYYNSPGGSAIGLEETAEAVTNLAKVKPVISQIGILGCSAAYYCAAGSTQIFAESKSTFTGSIGVRMLLYDFSKMFSDIGVEAVAIDTGQFKSLGAQGLPITEAQRAHLQEMVDLLMDGFKGVVSAGRGLTGDELEAVSDGRSMLATEAMEAGLIDGIQSLDQTVSKLVTMVRDREDRIMAESTPVAASFEDLKLLPGVTNDFIAEALEKKWTADAATSTWMDRQLAAVQEATEAKEAAEKKLKAKAPDGDLGDAPGSNSEPEGTDAIEVWDSAVAETMKSRELDRAESIKYLAKHKPELREQYLVAYTAKYGMPSDAYRRSLQGK